MATITVTTNLDVADPANGRLSLREAVAQANATAKADTVLFAPNLEGSTLVLTGGQLTISKDVMIDGDGNNDGIEVTLSGGWSGTNSGSRILDITGSTTNVRLTDLSLVDGNAGHDFRDQGGAVRHGGRNLELTDCTVRHCNAYVGGGIWASDGSRVTITGSELTSNRAAQVGGAIHALGDVQLTVRDSVLSSNAAGSLYGGGGALFMGGGTLLVEDSTFRGNSGNGDGGAILLDGGTGTIIRSAILENRANGEASSTGGGISLTSSFLSIHDSTIAGNAEFGGEYFGHGGGISAAGSDLVIRNTTLTGNTAHDSDHPDPDADPFGSGGAIWATGRLDIANSIVAGNSATNGPDITGTITLSDGHNVFGSPVTGDIAGDREGIAASSLFASIDPGTGGGQLNAAGVVPLRNSVTNPALSAADPFAVMTADQLGAPRPQPTGSLPDLGAAERNQTLSTTPSANNDTLTGTAAANTISGLAGNDRVHGLEGSDTLNGNDGGDTFDGGPGNDAINGGTGVDTVRYEGAVGVRVDLSGTADTARCGSSRSTR
jgi:hypothetical protein